MKSFKFSDQEIELLIAMYEDELKEVVDYSDRLRETLRKLRNETTSGEAGTPVREGKKRGRKPGQKSAVKTTGKKRGRKPKNAQPEKPQAEAAASPKAVAEKKKTKKAAVKGKKRGRKPGAKKVTVPEIKVAEPQPPMDSMN